MLQSLDTHWREHLAALDHLRQGIHLRGYAHKIRERYERRATFELIDRMLDTVSTDVPRVLMTDQISAKDAEQTAPHAAVQNVRYTHADYDDALGQGNEAAAVAQKPLPTGPKVGRNDPCPCGSGKKYKFCHGKLS